VHVNSGIVCLPPEQIGAAGLLTASNKRTIVLFLNYRGTATFEQRAFRNRLPGMSLRRPLTNRLVG
jgi:hypothetical protein